MTTLGQKAIEAARGAAGSHWSEGPYTRAVAAYLDALSSLPAQAVGVKALDDDQIMEIIRECFPWRTEAKIYDLLTHEKSPPMIPQATYDVPSYRASKFVAAIETRILSALVTPSRPAAVGVTDEMVEAAKAIMGKCTGEFEHDLRVIADGLALERERVSHVAQHLLREAALRSTP